MNVRHRLGDVLALGAGLLAVAYGAYLVAIGPDAQFVTEGGAAGTARMPTGAGLLAIGIGLVAFSAVAKHKDAGLWAAGILAAVLALVFLFSESLQFAVLAILLLVAAAAKTLASRDICRR